MDEIKHTPQLPALESAPTNDTSALTCYALDWRELSHQHQAEVVRLRQINAELAYALKGIIEGDSPNWLDIARAALTAAKGE